METNKEHVIREMSFYEKYTKRLLDIMFAVLVLAIFGWLYMILAVLVYIKMGRPIVFKQFRPGLIDSKTGKEHIFCMYKFRTMSNARDNDGKLLSDEERLGSFGKTLRASSMDELLEVFNILRGDMSVVGPRPQLVRDMVFMTDEQRIRHSAKPGLTGFAQTNGRNAITWEQKFMLDLEYIENISFLEDLKIVLWTVKKVFCRKESNSELDITDDYGDWLLNTGRISQEVYDIKQLEAKEILDRR